MAVFSGYSTNVSYSYRTTLYQALINGVGFTQGDIIRLQEQINDATGLATGIVSWTNVDTGLALAGIPVIGTDVSAWDSKRKKLASETLTVAAVAIAFATVPAGANHAEVHVWDADVSVTLDGATAPTATLGIRQADGQTFELEGVDEITNFKAIRLGTTSARLYVEYSREFDYND